MAQLAHRVFSKAGKWWVVGGTTDHTTCPKGGYKKKPLGQGQKCEFPNDVETLADSAVGPVIFWWSIRAVFEVARRHPGGPGERARITPCAVFPVIAR